MSFKIPPSLQKMEGNENIIIFEVQDSIFPLLEVLLSKARARYNIIEKLSVVDKISLHHFPVVALRRRV
jgi:hypothetical protein